MMKGVGPNGLSLASVPVLALVISAGPALGTEVWTGNGPLGGYVNTIAVNPKNPQIVYAGFRMNTYVSGVGMILKSTDGGAHWAAASAGISDEFVTAIAIDPQDPSILYATGGYLYKSTDGAASWQPLGFSSGGYYSEILIQPDRPEVVYLAGAPGIPLSWTADAGKTWTSVIGFGMGALALDLNHPSTLYASPNLQWVDRSDDGGVTWTRITTQQTAVVVRTLTVDPANSSRLYAGTEGGFYVSNDSGSHWALVPGPLAQASVQCLSIRTGAIYVGTNGAGVYKSSDAGTSWTQANMGLTGLGVQALAVDPSTVGILYAGTRAGVSKTNDGGSSWNDANIGIVRSQVFPIAVDPATPGRVYAGTYDGLFRTDDRGVSWDRLDLGAPDPVVEAVAVDPSSPQTIYAAVALQQRAGSFLNVLTKSTNGGRDWQPASSGFPTDGRVTAMVIDSSAPSTILVATFGNGIYKTTDGAQTWRDASEGLDDTIVDSLVIDPQDSSVLYAGTSDHLVYKTTDGGSRWSQLPGSPYRVFTLVIDPVRHKIIAGAWNGSISASNDGGATWSKSDAGLPSTPTFQPTIYSLANDRSNPDSIFAAVGGLASDNSDGGLFASTDGGVTWKVRNAGLSNYGINSAAVDIQGLFAYVGTNGGVFSLALNGDRPPINALTPTQNKPRVVHPRQ